MSEENEETSENIKKDDYDEINKESNDNEKSTGITINENPENIEIKEKDIIKPKLKIDMKRQRYPYSIVWTPIPCITWILPSIGHAGICTSEGIIYDFAGPYHVSVDDMAFGNPTKYYQLDLDLKEYENYDDAIEGGKDDYTEQNYSFCCNNCHSFIARCLNKLKYKGKSNYTMIHVWWILCIKSKYLSCGKFIQTYIGFFIVLIIILMVYFLEKI